MLVGTSNNQDEEQPKLEDFLGSYSFADKPNFNGLLTNDSRSTTGAAIAANPLGISMIKTLLRNQPVPQQQMEGYIDGGKSSASKNKQMVALDGQSGAIEAVTRKSIDTFGQRTSIYRGVTGHRWTRRYEAHLWDNSCRREGQTHKGHQVYLNSRMDHGEDLETRAPT